MDECENPKKSMDKIFDEANQFLSELVFSHVKWMLVINTGALLWFVGILDKFTIRDQLFSKWWAISTILLLIVSEIILYKGVISVFKISSEFKMMRIKYHTNKNISEDINKMSQIMPSVKICYVADILFLIGIISMISYVITYFIRFR